MDILKKYNLTSKQILWFGFFGALFSFLASLFWGHQGSLLIDCGREAYIPSAMLKGEVLYRDIINPYGPLAYQINALAYKILGENLNSLYFAGLSTSAFILTSLYLISRQFCSPKISAMTPLFVMSACVFNTFIFNFIFPYSYSILYALCAFLLSALFFIRYIKNGNESNIPISFFFIGVSIASKYEFIAFLAFLAVYVLFIKPVSKKNMLFSLSAFLLMPAVSLLILFMQGLRVDDLVNHTQIMKSLISTDALSFFYSNYTGLYPSLGIIWANVINFSKTILTLTGISLVLYMFVGFLQQTPKNKIKKVIQAILYSIFIYLFVFPWYKNLVTPSAFSWMPLSAFAIFVIMYAVPALRKDRTKDNAFIVLAFIACLASIKSFFYLSLNVYGPFFIPLIFMINLIFWCEYLPRLIKIIDKKVWSTVAVINISIVCLFLTVTKLGYITQHLTFPVKTEKGTMYTSNAMGQVHKQTIDYINSNAKPEDTILVVPEGPMLNFLTGHKTNGMFYSLIPVYMEAFGENNVINELEQSPPDYIIVNSRNSSDYGKAYFGKDYGLKVAEFIGKNYKLDAVYKTSFAVGIYKKKTAN